jgi:hypothetical protein
LKKKSCTKLLYLFAEKSSTINWELANVRD